MFKNNSTSISYGYIYMYKLFILSILKYFLSPLFNIQEQL